MNENAILKIINRSKVLKLYKLKIILNKDDNAPIYKYVYAYDSDDAYNIINNYYKQYHNINLINSNYISYEEILIEHGLILNNANKT